MRFAVLAAASLLTLAGAAHAQEPAEAPAAQASVTPATVTDDELLKFSAAMTKLRTVAAAVGSGTPTEEQQAEMAAAVESSGLEIDRFNAIAQISGDPLFRARLNVASAPASAEGSVGASISDDELGRYARAATQARTVAQAGGTPAEQQAGMAAAVEGQGLTLDRFNAISAATSSDSRLRARVALEQLKAEA
jgi:methionine-rich copper-binding protein CopC